MPTTKMPVWMRSEYVTIGQPPFHKIRGQEAAPCPGANRLPLLAVPDITIAYLSKKRNKNRPFDRGEHQQSYQLDKSIFGGYTENRKGRCR